MALLDKDEFRRFLVYALQESSREELEELKKDLEFYIEMTKRVIEKEASNS